MLSQPKMFAFHVSEHARRYPRHHNLVSLKRAMNMLAMHAQRCPLIDHHPWRLASKLAQLLATSGLNARRQLARHAYVIKRRRGI